MTTAILIVAVIVLAVLLFGAWVSGNRARGGFDRARTEAHQARTDLAVYQQNYLYTKQDVERARQDSRRRSHSSISGKVAEHLAPLLPGWPVEFNPHDARFIGNPVDFLVFQGLNEGQEVSVFVVEAKTGRSRLNGNERRIRDAINAGRVHWREVWLDTQVPGLPEPVGETHGNGEGEQRLDTSNDEVGFVPIEDWSDP